MNIALLTQAIQGTPQKNGGEVSATPTGQFLQLLSTMLGTSAETTSEVAVTSEAEHTMPLENLSTQLEQWLQQPDSLQWLKSLPADSYRTFMDAYIGLLTQVGSETTDVEPATVNGLAAPLTTVQAMVPGVTLALGKTAREATGQKQTPTLEANVRTIEQIVSQYKGTLVQTPKTVPVLNQSETPFMQTTQVPKENPDWLPKGMMWSRPQIDAETVMYASKGSLPDNLHARIEAALQRAPFKSGADGSKVFTVRLYPEQLGELVVKLERQNGELVVKLFASNQEAKQLLQSQLQQLQQTLQPLTQNLRVEVNLTQQALETKSSAFDSPEQSEREQQEQPKGETEDDDHPAEDE